VGNDGPIKGKVVQMPQDLDGWTPVEDDGCRWILDLAGGPFPVLPCKACRCPVDIESTPNLKHHRVRCLKCGRQTPEMVGGELLDVLKLWNEMVE
jgi:hypothetical protein